MLNWRWLRQLGWLLLCFTAVACTPTPFQPTTENETAVLPTLAATAVIPTPFVTPSATLPTTITPLPSPTTTAIATATLPSPTITPIATATLPPTLTPAPPTAAGYQLTLTPGEPQPYLSRFGLVAYYGSPTGRGLGILGELPRAELNASLRDTAVAYTPYFPQRTILPTYHMVILVANPHPPAYFHRVDLALLETWIAEAKAAETAVILDMQPGRGDLMAEFERIRYLLYEPHVHLAIDPEFVMSSSQIPGQQIGQLYAADINTLQAELDAIAQEIGLNRVLILHQFVDRMLPDKEAIRDYPHVELVIDSDGVGADRAKVRNYNQYAAEPAFDYGGFKLFPTDGDYPVMTPEQVMTDLSPPPVLIIYQ